MIGCFYFLDTIIRKHQDWTIWDHKIIQKLVTIGLEFVLIKI